MKYLITNIEYDTDGENIDLPIELKIEVPNNLIDEEDIEEFISDEISNETGFCHKGFTTSLIMKTPEDYLVELQAVSDKDWERLGFDMNNKRTFSLTKGKKFVKVVVNSYGSISVHCFIDPNNGDLYKAASWKIRAKGVRGNINNDRKPYLCGEFYIRS